MNQLIQTATSWRQPPSRSGQRIRVVYGFGLFAAVVALATTVANGKEPASPVGTTTPQPKVAVKKVIKSNREWKALLTDEQYRVLRQAGTERAFDNRYHDHKAKGSYGCVACGNRLFPSAAKFDSGTGWPSYYQPIDSEAVSEQPDSTFGFFPRTEVVCSRCDGHLGHVFDDGPKPTGKRYCINSAALTFFPE